MNYSFLIRRADETDAPAIKDIMTEAFTRYMKESNMPGTVEALEESISEITHDIQNKHVYIAIVDDLPVGSLRIMVDENNNAWLTRFGVRSEYRNIGIGKSLMNLVDKLMAELAVNKLFLYTSSKAKELIRFYYGMGFYIESTSDDRGYLRALLVKEY